MRLVDPGGCGIRPAFSLEVWRQHERPILTAFVPPTDDPTVGVYPLRRLEGPAIRIADFGDQVMHDSIIVTNEGTLDAGRVPGITDCRAGIVDCEGHAVIIA